MFQTLNIFPSGSSIKSVRQSYFFTIFVFAFISNIKTFLFFYNLYCFERVKIVLTMFLKKDLAAIYWFVADVLFFKNLKVKNYEPPQIYFQLLQFYVITALKAGTNRKAATILYIKMQVFERELFFTCRPPPAAESVNLQIELYMKTVRISKL